MYGQGVEVKSLQSTANGIAVNAPCWLLGVHWTSALLGGELVFRDGGAGGPIVSQMRMPALNTATGVVDFRDGLVFNTNLYVSLPSGASATLIYNLAG